MRIRPWTKWSKDEQRIGIQFTLTWKQLTDWLERRFNNKQKPNTLKMNEEIKLSWWQKIAAGLLAKKAKSELDEKFGESKTEGWLTLAFQIFIAAGVILEALPWEWAAAAGAVSTSIYGIVRAIAKKNKWGAMIQEAENSRRDFEDVRDQLGSLQQQLKDIGISIPKK